MVKFAITLNRWFIPRKFHASQNGPTDVKMQSKSLIQIKFSQILVSPWLENCRLFGVSLLCLNRDVQNNKDTGRRNRHTLINHIESTHIESH